MLKRVLFTLSIVFLCLQTITHAGEEWRSSFPPLSIDLDQAVTNAFAAQFGAKVVGSKVPFARRLFELKTGEIDLLAGLLKDNSREEYAYFLSVPYKNKTNKIFIMRKGEGGRLQKYEDLYNLEVGVQIGSKYFTRFDEDTRIRKYSSTSDENRLKMLLHKRFDALIHTELYGNHLVYNLGLETKVEVAPYKYTQDNPVYIAISKKSKLYERRDELDKVFKRLVVSGEIDTVIRSYFKSIGLPAPVNK